MTDGMTQTTWGVIKRLRRFAVPALALGVCVLVLVAAQDLTKTLDYHAVVKTLRRLPSGLLVRSLLATLVSYLALVGRDAAGLRAIGARVPRRCCGSAAWRDRHWAMRSASAR